MKKRLAITLLFVLLALVLASCSGASPSGVVRSFYDYAQRGDYDKAAALFSQSALDRFGISKIESVVKAQQDALQKEGGVQKFEIIKETIINNKALVEVKLTMGNGQIKNDSINLVKEDKDWKIDISK